MKKLVRLLCGAGALMSFGFAAAPASAYYVVTYTTASGAYYGAEIYCDNGFRYYAQGGTSPYYTIEYFPQNPC